MNKHPGMYRRSRIQLSVFCLLLILSGTLHHAVSETFTILPSTADDTACPNESQCFTVSQYASNSSLSSNMSNITLELQPGTHSLNFPLTVNDISSFTMRGINATLLCVKNSTDFYFSAIEYVYLGGISFVNCGGQSSIVNHHVKDVGNFTLENSTFRTDEPFYIRSANYVLIANSTFTNSPRGVFSIIASPLILRIRDCVFSDNIQTLTSTSRVRAVITSTALRSSVTIENSIFKNNHMSTVLTSGAFQGRGQSLTIINSTFVNNTGGRFGAGAITLRYRSVVISGSSFRDNTGLRSAGAVTIRSLRSTDTITALISQSVFLNNTATGGDLLGGAVYVSASNSSITIHQGTFVDNNGTSVGALSFVTDDSHILVNRSTFLGNTGHDRADGGAVAVQGLNVSLIVKRSAFTRNKIEGSGGVLSLSGYFPMISIKQSEFTKNNAGDRGGVISVFLEQHGDAELVISSSVFSNNSAHSCGVLEVTSSLFRQERTLHSQNVQVNASIFTSNVQTSSIIGSGVMCLAYTNATIVHSNFSHNSGSGHAGALLMEQGMLAVEGSVFGNNMAGGDGGVIYGCRNFTGVFNQTVFTNNCAVDSGGVMYLTDSQVTIFDSTIGFNQAGRGGAIAIFRGSLEIENSNVFNNTAEFGSVIIVGDGAEVNVSDRSLVSVDPIMTLGTTNCILCTTEKMSSDAVSLSALSSSIFIMTSIIVFLKYYNIY